MKKMTLTLLLTIMAFSSLANEAHSPQYKCTPELPEHDIMYLLIGNEFPQSTDLDFSDEVLLARAEEYSHVGVPDTRKFKILTKDAKDFETDINIQDTEIGLIQTSMKFQSLKLTHTIQHPISTCDFPEQCTEEVYYDCIEQRWVD